MKKIISKIKKVFIMLEVYLFSMSTSVFAITPLYGPPNEDYATPKSSTNYGIWEVIKYFIIPLVFVIGAIIYFKKSLSSVTRKIITIAIALIIVILLCLGINYWMVNLI